MVEPNRDDISSGMVAVRPPRQFHDDSERFGALYCFPFHLEQESLPPAFQVRCLRKRRRTAALSARLQGVLWVLHSALCNVQGGEKGAFVNLKSSSFRCLYGAKNEKPIIIQEDGFHAPEVQLECRILAMEKEHYLVLVARPHLCFSLRHAIIHTLTQSKADQTDERRAAFNSYAQSLRETLGMTPAFDRLRCAK
jgi:hypothetical protein